MSWGLGFLVPPHPGCAISFLAASWVLVGWVVEGQTDRLDLGLETNLALFLDSKRPWLLGAPRGTKERGALR